MLLKLNRKYIVYRMSLSEFDMLVIISAKKKSVNFTLPNGDVITWINEISNYFLACLYPNLRNG